MWLVNIYKSSESTAAGEEEVVNKRKCKNDIKKWHKNVQI